MIGIYKIHNIVNDKIYIGQSLNVKYRISRHIYELSKGKHKNEHLQNSWNKYGQENFEFTIIEECTEDQLDKREQYWLDYYGGLDNNKTFNLREAGNRSTLTKSSRTKISNSLKGIQAWNKGLTRDNDYRVAQYSDKLKGTKLKEKQKQQISQTVKQHHLNGDYDYEQITQKRLQTQQENIKNGKIRKVRKDKGTKRNEIVGKRISEAKKKGYALRRQQGIIKVAHNKGKKLNKETGKYE